MCSKSQLSKLIMIFINCHQLMPVPNFRSLGWFSFSSAVNSFWQLMKADDSCKIFFWWDLHLPRKADACAKFQLSRMIFIFISCQQLLSAVDSSWQLLRKKLNGIFIYPLKLIPVPNFSSPGCLRAQLESVKDVQTYAQTDVRTDAQTPGENSANSGPAGLVPGPELSN